MSGFFITGTDTGVGKTVVSSCLASGLGAIYWKPIQSGVDQETDSEFVSKFIGSKNILPERYKLKNPLSPHHAAELEGIEIDLSRIEVPNTSKNLIVEGAGGVLVPLNSEVYILDLAKKIDLPCIVVARSGLGTLNHTLLTINELRRNGLVIAGVVLNGKRNRRNKNSIEALGKVKIILEMEEAQNIDSFFLNQQFNKVNLDERYFRKDCQEQVITC